MGQREKKIFHQMFLCLQRGDKGSCVGCELITRGGTDIEIRVRTES